MYPVFLDKPPVVKTVTPQNVYETITIDDDDVSPGIPIHAQTSCSKYGVLNKLYFTNQLN